MRHVALLASFIAFAAPAAAQAAGWTASLGGGTSRLGPDLNQTYASASLARDFGASYLRGDVTWFTGDDGAGRLRTSADTIEFGLALGRSFGALTAEISGAAGHRSFDDVRVTGPNGQTVTVGGSGSLWSIGGSLSYLVPLSEHWSLTPSASISYSSLDVARPVAGPRGRATRNPFVQRERGTTGAATLSLDRTIGETGSLGVQASVVTTSNAASVTRTGAAAPRLLEGSGRAESWAEFGANATIGLSPAVALDLAVVQTAGLSPSESATGSAALRFRF